jgi:hypothetical protein
MMSEDSMSDISKGKRERTTHIYETSKAQYTEGRWGRWLEPSLQGPFSEADGKLDIFLASI